MIAARTTIRSKICCSACGMEIYKCSECEDYFDIQNEGEEIICVESGESHMHKECYE